MANEKVSQMTSLTAAEIAGDDLFLITDTSARESKKLTASDMLWYIQTTGSFNAATAVNANTASYLLPIGRNITVTSASYSTTSSYSHFAERAMHSDTASLANTASYIDFSGMGISEIDTASFLKHTTGVNNGTASYSLTSSFVNLSKTSSFLLYTPGLNNGTASYSITGSHAITSSYAITAKSSSYSTSGSYALTSSLAHLSLTSSYSTNGTVGYSNVITHLPQVGSGGSVTSPHDLTGLSSILQIHSPNSHFLINMSVVSAQCKIGLWYSTSLSLTEYPLIPTIGSLVGDYNDAATISTTYIHTPSLSAGTKIRYKGVVFNDSSDPYFINRSRSNVFFGTSSMSILEFIL